LHLPAWLQLAQLPRLSSLSLRSCGYSAASLGALSSLSGSLTRLDMYYGCSSLSALTQLRDLRLWEWHGRRRGAAQHRAAAPAPAQPHGEQHGVGVAACGWHQRRSRTLDGEGAVDCCLHFQQLEMGPNAVVTTAAAHTLAAGRHDE